MAAKILICLLLLFSHSLSASGRILVKKGNVSIDGKPVSQKTQFNNGQTLTVGKSSLAVIRFENGNTLKVNEETSITLEASENDKSKNDNNIFTLLKGSSFFQKNKKNPGNMTVKASSVSMGVRGTTFFVSYGVENPEDIYMCVNSGVVAVKGASDKKEVLVKEGEGVVISKGKKTSNPKFLPWTKNLNWKLSSKEKDLVNKANIEESYSDFLDKDYD